MKTAYECILITGGVGFIGSHLLDRLVSLNNQVTVLDNSSSHLKEFKSQFLKNKNVQFMLGDCTNPSDIQEAMKDVDIVYHLAANPEVRLERNNPATCFKQNIYATHILLEEMRKSKTHTIAFTSTSTVYGDSDIMPTPETHPTRPISLYGASKLASEALIMAYAHTYKFKAIIFRLANIVGPESKHGVIYDFTEKLKKNSEELEILGDGTQIKSYLYIKDCIDAILLGMERAEKRVEVFNVGSEDQVDVKTIARIVTKEMNLKNVKFRFTRGVDGGRGWKGDVKNMLLDVNRIKALGWSPRYNSAEAIRRTVKTLLDR